MARSSFLPCGDAEDVRGGRAGGEAQLLELFDGEPGVLDGGAGVAGGGTAPADGGPEGRVEQALDPGQAGGVGPDVLEEPQLATRLEHPADLGERRGEVRYRAQHKRR